MEKTDDGKLIMTKEELVAICNEATLNTLKLVKKTIDAMGRILVKSAAGGKDGNNDSGNSEKQS